MAKKLGKVTVNALERAVKNQALDAVVAVQWEDTEIQIKRLLGLKEMMEFVNSVTSACFTSDTNEYMPEVLAFAVRCSVLEMYANFTLPTNIETRYRYVYGCDAYDVVVSNIDQGQFETIQNAIEERIDAMVQSNIDAVTKQINELGTVLDDLEQRFGGLFEGISQDDLNAMIVAVANGSLDEEKLMKAYMNERRQEKGESPSEVSDE